MAVQIVRHASGTVPAGDELQLMARAVERFGRVTLLVPSTSERDVCRRAAADAHLSVGLDIVTPTAWIEGLWELLGDGRRLCTNLQRQLLIADTLYARDERELAPLRANPGTVRMLARMAKDLLPFAEGAKGPADAATRVVLSLLDAYDARLRDRGLIEPAQAAVLLADAVADLAPACARCAIVRDVTTLPAHLVRLLAQVGRAGSVQVLLRASQQVWEEEVARAFSQVGCAVERALELGGAEGADGTATRALSFLEVAGPHARARAYADELASLLSSATAGESGGAKTAVVACARPAELFDELAGYLATRGISSSVTRFSRFSQTVVGQQFAALSDVVSRMKAAQEGQVADGAWWPAPELTDWLYAPVSGADAALARGFDKKIRSNRALGVEGVLRELQSVQSRAGSARRKLADDHPMRRVPAVCSEVVQFIWQDRPVSAFKSMLSAIEALPASSFGTRDGRCRQATERAMAERAVDVLMNEARALDVSQAVATKILDGLCTASRERAASASFDGEVGTVVFMTLADAAVLEPASVDAVLLADVDVASYPLSHEEGPVVTLGSALGVDASVLEPAARLRDQAERAICASRGPVALARVSHDRQAKDRYPAALWTELLALRGGDEAPVEKTGEGDVAGDFDPAGTGTARVERVLCLPPQRLGVSAVPYLVLMRRTEDGALVPRQFSASQIESYVGCPLCWFVSSRVRPSMIDAGFTNMEKGNFVHDAMDRFHEEVRERGMRRVTPENLRASLELLDEVFAAVRAEHARGKTASSAALVALSPTEQAQIDDILPQLRRVVRYEADALAPFAPEYLEYSFNGLGVDYAGWPLGGRIDRVDVDAEDRAVVIDYKHRSDANPFKLKDPTVPLKKTGEVPADDPRWLPEHTQTLIYGQALRRALGLDVRGALYFSTKGKVAMRGAVSSELAEEEPGDGRVPGLRDGFPAVQAGGTMDFDALLDRVEVGIAERLGELRAGRIAAAADPLTSCYHNHPLGFERRDA